MWRILFYIAFTGEFAIVPVDPQKSEAVRRELDKLRLRLLDITKRNNLISFRHGKSSVRIVDADHEAIYKELLAGEELPFIFVPEPDKEYVDEIGEKPAPADYAKELGWATSVDLVSGQGQTDNLRVLQYQDGLEATLRKIGTTAKTAREESGINLLHVVFGFLEWRESDDSSKVSYAPLLVVPVELVIPKSKDTNRSFRLKYNDEDLTTNLSLVEKMRIDFGLQIPELGEDETPEQYFQRFAPILEQKKDWKIRYHVSLALLSFAKLLMYLDLDSDRWGNRALDQHPRLLELFAGDSNEGSGLAGEFDIDEEEIKKAAPPLIYDADTLFHKLREALLNTVPQQKLSGVVEIDGAHFSGRPRKGRKKKPVPINTTENKYQAQHRSKLPDSAFPHHPNRRIVMIMREHNGKGRGAGRSVVEICPSETAPYIDGLVKKWIEVGSTVRTDELPAYKNLPELFYKHESVNHSVEFSTDNGVNENQAESFFSRMRRAQKGIYHRITPRYMHDYANEMVWREEVRRETPGSQLRILVRRVFYAGRSKDWRGYCQKNSRQEERLFMAAA
jgi:hypothetical protein